MTAALFLNDPAPYGIQELASGQRSYKPAMGGARKATGLITFTANPAPADSIVLNGFTWTFSAAATALQNIQIADTLSHTLDALVTALNASTEPLLAIATYAKSGTTILTIGIDAEGIEGNDYTLSSAQVNGVASGANLAGGATQDKLGLAKHGAFELVTAAGTAQYWDLLDGSDGQEITIYLKTKGAGANAVIRGNFGAAGVTLTLGTVDFWGKFAFIAGKWRTIYTNGTVA